MAAKETVWNVVVDDIPYKIEYKKNQVSVNGGQSYALKKLKKGNGGLDTEYYVPVGDKEVVLHVRQFATPALTYEGKDCSTGEEYVPMKMAKWVWVFIILHAINFFLIIGGAVGGAIQGGVIYAMISVSADQKKSTSTRVLTCLAIWLISTVVEFILALLLVSALS